MGKVGRKWRGGIKVRKGRSDGEGRGAKREEAKEGKGGGRSGNGGVTEYEGRSERARIEGGAQNVNETKRVPKTANRRK